MQRNIILIAAAGLIISCTTPKTEYTLTGHVVNTDHGTVYLQKFIDKTYQVIDSASLSDGQFSFSKPLPLPEIYALTLDTTVTPFMVFLDKGATFVELDSSAFYRNSVVKGSALHDLFVEYKKERVVPIDSFIKANPNSLVSAYALYRDFSYRLPPEELEADILLLDTALHQTPYIQTLRKHIAHLKETGVGHKAPDFTLTTPGGKEVSLYSMLGKSYLLIDFWASWCGPCRRENPNVVNAYRKYHGKGFDILGVSLDKTYDPWVKAIADDNLTWTHVSELNYWKSEVAKQYGVRSIPSNVLVDKDGIIVARNLRKEALHEKLAELYD